jgi:hypothetical protein
MDYVGLFCLGIFVGSIAAVGLRFISDANTWKQGMTAMIAATLSGATVLFVDRYKDSAAIGAYPMGLLIALIWGYIPVAVANIKSNQKVERVIGYLHLSAAVVATLLASGLIVPFAWKAAVGAMNVK